MMLVILCQLFYKVLKMVILSLLRVTRPEIHDLSSENKKDLKTD